MKKILIIKMSAIGDVFMALPHVDVILSHHSQDQVWIMTTPSFKDVFINHPGLRVVLLDRNKKFGTESAWARTLWVRKQQFDAIYDLQGNRTSRWLVRFSRAPRRVGTQPRSVYNFHPAFYYTKNALQNVFDRLNETLFSAGLSNAKAGCTIYASAIDIEKTGQWKEKNDLIDGHYALMHAGSSKDWPSKRWPKDYFFKLAILIETIGIRCVWVGGREDGEINSVLSQNVGIDSTDMFSIIQLYLLGKRAKFAVTNDSGPMHILSASGIPVYSFFGPTNWIRSHAPGQKSRVIKKDIECSPCFLGKCPAKKEHACLNRIDPEYVFAKIIKEIDF